MGFVVGTLLLLMVYDGVPLFASENVTVAVPTWVARIFEGSNTVPKAGPFVLYRAPVHDCPEDVTSQSGATYHTGFPVPSVIFQANTLQVNTLQRWSNA